MVGSPAIYIINSLGENELYVATCKQLRPFCGPEIDKIRSVLLSCVFIAVTIRQCNAL